MNEENIAKIPLEEIKKLTLAEKLSLAMRDLDYVTKDGFNSFHKYKYVTEANVLAKLQDACVAYRFIILPSVLSCMLQGDLTTVQIEFTVINIDDRTDAYATKVYGQGQDKGDKGVYKAITGAYKYFALKTFLIPSGDDPEVESEHDRHPTPPPHAPQGSPVSAGYQPAPARQYNNQGPDNFELTNIEVPSSYWGERKKNPEGKHYLLLQQHYPGWNGEILITKKGEDGKWYIAVVNKNKPPAQPVAQQTFLDDDIPFGH